MRWILLGTLVLGCGGTGGIVGRVVDGEGVALPKAEVATRPETDLVLTNVRGIFSLTRAVGLEGVATEVASGRYVLTVRRAGYEDATVTFDYTGGELRLADVVLTPRASQVTATPPEPSAVPAVEPGTSDPPVGGPP